MHQFDFKNKTAIITGGARGFGLDIAKKFLLFGAKVFIWDIDENELIKTTKEINNSNLEYNLVDVSNFQQIENTGKMPLLSFPFLVHYLVVVCKSTAMYS